MPHRCLDPVIIASHIVVRLQTIVSRVVAPDAVAVITVGSIHAGEADNVICDQAFFTVNIRTLDETVRQTVLDNVKKTITAECTAANCERPPQIEHCMSIPLTSNTAAPHQELCQVFQEYFSPCFQVAEKSSLASEDFSILASSIGKPYYFWLFGDTESKLWDSLMASNQLKKPLSITVREFAPAIHPTMQTGADAMTVAVLAILQK
ncbi:hypothetical protein LTR46_011757 [Exophiala xenobiotica]|nr:hypothetical protein LTR46_011757 [Exophiala xenobiotica]